METAAYSSPIGLLAVEASDAGLDRIRFIDGSDAPGIPARSSPSLHIRHLAEELDSYFAGYLRRFTIALAPTGTPFQLKVWSELARIPYGCATSYADIACRIGAPKATRAVGGANNRNPLPIVLPCHRVIGKSGQLVGYGGQIWRKRRLLEIEGVLPSPLISAS